MTIETILRKRPAAHAGEVGLFPSSEMADEDMSLIGMGNDVTVTVVSKAAETIRKFMWALATVVGRSVEGCHDKDDGMELLCVKCRHMTHKLDPVTGKMEIRRKSTLRIGGEVQLRLLKRMIYVTETEIIPGIDSSALRAELEKMVGETYPPQAPPKPKRRPRTIAPAPKTALESQRMTEAELLERLRPYIEGR